MNQPQAGESNKITTKQFTTCSSSLEQGKEHERIRIYIY